MHIIGRKNPLIVHKCLKQIECRKMKKPVNSSSASVNQTQFWIEIRLDVSRKQGPTHIGPDLDPNGLILKVFLIFFVIFL